MEKRMFHRCPKCSGVLITSELPEYAFQCVECDEDFFDFEAVESIVTLEDTVAEDSKQFDDVGMSVDLNARKKLTVQMGEHTGYCFVQDTMVERLGMDYLANHAALYYISCLDEWHVRISENDYYNDTMRNPEKVIPVEFVEIEIGTGFEVYKGVENGRYYLREVSRREPFAKWLVLGNCRKTDDGNEPRANLVFMLGDQKEKVRYDDWNGVCAYSDTFNPNFR